MATQCPRSCDTFVYLPDRTENGLVIFGKNSDRPAEEVQEIVYVPAKKRETAENAAVEKLKCTYIEIDQVPETLDVILSKPSWMWGAEMGANSYGVCIGNEAIWGKMEPESEKKLLGMDLVRLGLERAKTAREALDVITNLLEVHGQGGPCSETEDMTYHNGFLIADATEAWVLETSGPYWAAERVESGYRNISNCFSIGTKIDLMREGLVEDAKKFGYWKHKRAFNFTEAFSHSSPSGRYKTGCRLLGKLSVEKKFNLKSMMDVLRDDDINIGGYEGGFATTSSQVSAISKFPSASHHWFTGTSDSKHSVFKPFLFRQPLAASTTSLTTSPSDNDDRRHELYKLHEELYSKIVNNPEILTNMVGLEDSLIAQVEQDLSETSGANAAAETESDVFKNAVDAEMKLYSNFMKK